MHTLKTPTTVRMMRVIPSQVKVKEKLKLHLEICKKVTEQEKLKN